MNQQNARSLALFDLLARSWTRPSPVAALCFSTDGSALAFASIDGSVAIAPVADPEPPEARIRVSGDLGQTTIRPREKPAQPLIAMAALANRAAPICADGEAGFLVGGQDGAVTALSDDGSLGDVLLKLGGPVAALDRSQRNKLAAATDGERLTFRYSSGDVATHPLGSKGAVAALALSPDGGHVAIAAEGISIWTTGRGAARLHEIALASRPTSIVWSADRAWLACGLETGGFALVDVAAGKADSVGGFPAPVRAVSWSKPAHCLFASGAFRIAGWSMENPPIGGQSAGALETGRGGLVLVETVAAHPKKKLVAAGYADGQIVVAMAGSRDELVVRTSGGAVTGLLWSADGRHLAMAGADGAASIVTFPDQMFK